MVAPSAFREVIASRGVFLFLNHPGDAGVRPSLASTSAGTLYLEEDRHGLWFEAALADDAAGIEAYQNVIYACVSGVLAQRGIGIHDSSGCSYGDEPSRVGSVFARATSSTRFRATWAATNIAARSRRAQDP